MKITTEPDRTTIDFEASAETGRRCGGCQLCCKLLPIRALDKPGLTRCRYQRSGKGCAIWHKAAFPEECRLWSCRWLAAPEETRGMKRPDRAHYVIDPMLDTIRFVADDDGAVQDIDALQVWMDPAFPRAADDPELRGYLYRMAERHGLPALLRWSPREATAVFAPPLNEDRAWHEQRSRCNPGIGRYAALPPALRPPV